MKIVLDLFILFTVKMWTIVHYNHLIPLLPLTHSDVFSFGMMDPWSSEEATSEEVEVFGLQLGFANGAKELCSCPEGSHPEICSCNWCRRQGSSTLKEIVQNIDVFDDFSWFFMVFLIDHIFGFLILMGFLISFGIVLHSFCCPTMSCVKIANPEVWSLTNIKKEPFKSCRRTGGDPQICF